MIGSKELAQHRAYDQQGDYHRRVLRYPFSPWRVRYDVSMKMLGGISPGQKCLDFGGGDGAMATMLADKGAQVTVFDFDQLPLNFSKIDPRLSQVLGKDHLPIQNEVFEKVTMLEVLEHIPPGLDDFALAECRRVMVKGADLVVSVPSTNIDISEAHYRHYTHEDLVKKIESVGFQVRRIVGLRDITPSWARNGRFSSRVAKGLIYSADFVYRNLNGHMGLVECNPNDATKFIAHAQKV